MEGAAMKKKRVPWKPALVFPALLLLLPLTACHPEPVVPQDARILIIDPAAESTQAPGPVTITTYVQNFMLVDGAGNTSTKNVVEFDQFDHTPPEGQIVYYMDVTPPLTDNATALTATGTYHTSIDTAYTWENVPPGQHVFWAQLVDKDVTPLRPPSAVRVYVTVQ
jgi:hypothetical protein